MGPWNGRKSGCRAAEEPVGVKEASAAGRGGAEGESQGAGGNITGDSEAERPENVRVHTYTQTPHTHTPHAASGWRIHCGVEVTELSTNKQHTLSLYILLFFNLFCVFSLYAFELGCVS